MARRRRRKTFLQRYGRLIAFVVVVALVITGIVLLVRGIRGKNVVPETVSETQSQAAVPEESRDAEPADESAAEGDMSLTEMEEEPEKTIVVPDTVEYGVFTGSRKAVIRSAGDIILHANIYKSYATEDGYDFASIFDSIRTSLSKADYTVINVDGPTGGTSVRGYSEYPQFNSPEQILDAVKASGVDMMTLANNHALDTFFDGLKLTVDNVEKAGLDHIGAYRTQEEYDTPKVVDINGIKVGFTNYTVSTNNLTRSSAPEASVYGLRMTSNSDVQKDIAMLRAYGAEIVVVYMHWGEEYERTPNTAMRKMASKIAQAGADVIIGGHPHVVQPAQWLETRDASTGEARKTLVLYSMGNFLSDQRQQYRDSGIIFEFTIQDNAATGKVEVTNPVYIPTYVWRVTKEGGKGYKYRVIAVGEAIDNRPSSMSDEVYQRIQEVAEETKANMARTGVGTAQKS